MANEASVDEAQFKLLKESVDVLSGNLDQLFLIIMGCCIFCEYEFFVAITFSLQLNDNKRISGLV